MSDTALNLIVRYGTNAERVAFTPNPAVGSKVLYIWYETDNPPDLYVWDSSTWALVNGSVTGITQLTGGVTAGPGSGSQVATIADEAVTYAKMQNVSAISKLLGRGSAAGAGDVEEVTLGTNLTMSGTTLNASGGSASWTLKHTRSVGSGPTEDFTTDLNYNEILIVLVGVTTVSITTIAVRVSIDAGSTFLSTGGDYRFVPANGTEQNEADMGFFSTTNTTARTAFRTISNFNGTTSPKMSMQNNQDKYYRIPTTSALNAIRVMAESGNFDGAGTIYIFGR